MSNLILIRHGQSLWNKERRFTGWADINLTKKGRLEAKLAGKLIKELNIDFNVCFTSQLKRAKNTLKIILKVLKKSNAKIINISNRDAATLKATKNNMKEHLIIGKRALMEKCLKKYI